MVTIHATERTNLKRLVGKTDAELRELEELLADIFGLATVMV